MNLKILYLLSILVFTIPLTEYSALCEAQTRHQHPLGFQFGVNAEIPLAGIGLNVGYNVTDFMRVYGSFGGLNGFTENAPVKIWNNSFGPVFQFILTSVSFLVTVGQIKWSSIRDFYDMEIEEKDNLRVLAYGGGTKFFLPGQSLSPTLGLGYAGYSSDEHLGLSKNGSHLFMSGGFDYQADSGFQIGLGGTYTPKLPRALRWRFGLTLGFFI